MESQQIEDLANAITAVEADGERRANSRLIDVITKLRGMKIPWGLLLQVIGAFLPQILGNTPMTQVLEQIIQMLENIQPGTTKGQA